ncbi:MAG: hypothetical protein JNL83_03635 [Myxococcales bacterium]|nr:hypothetical protein [Myxococcales bacterium]
MKTAKNLTVLLALAMGSVATGCAADSPDDVGDDGGGGGGGGGGGDVTPTPTDATGTYSMRSTFDLATNAPGKVGEVVNTIIAATDGGDDPANWILEQVIAKLPSGTVKTLLNGARPFVAGYLNDRLLEFAPDFVGTMVQMGHDFGAMAKNFGVNEQLQVTGAPGAYSAQKTVVGAHFKIDQVESDVAFADFGGQNIVVQNVAVTLDQTGKLGLGEHKLALKYGQVLHMGVDAVLVPMLDPTASNLGQLLQNQVDCTAVGNLIASQIGGFGAGALTTACNAGLTAGANFIYSKIDSIDGSALEFTLTGTAKALDKNGDKKIDSIATGAWSGNLSYGGTPSALADAKFFGERM